MDQQPVIIKKIKKGGHGGHHGGAWKVAYADFVTAMMAFFLLLWLLNVTSPEQKMGLAEYFTPTIGIKDSMGIGFKGGIKPTTKGHSKTDLTAPGIISGQPKQGPISGQPSDKTVRPDPDADSTSAPQKSEEVIEQIVEDGTGGGNADTDEFKDVESGVKQALEQDPDLKDYQENVVIQDSPEGLKIDVIDDQKRPMFIPGGAILTEQGKKVLDSMANIIVKTPNNIQVLGHTDASAISVNPQYTNWELSADRANTARRFLSSTQLEPDRVAKVVGMADRELLTPQEPTSPRNRRITLLLMRGSYFRDPKTAPTTRALLSVPDAKIKKPEEENLPPTQEAPPERDSLSIPLPDETPPLAP